MGFRSSDALCSLVLFPQLTLLELNVCTCVCRAGAGSRTKKGSGMKKGSRPPCLCFPAGARSAAFPRARQQRALQGRGWPGSPPASAALNSIRSLLSVSHNRCLMIIMCYCIISHISFLSAASYSGSLNYVNSLLEIAILFTC